MTDSEKLTQLEKDLSPAREKTTIKGVIGWLFRPLEAPTTPFRAILWWEKRRIPFNVFIFVYAVLAISAHFWLINVTGQVKDGENFIEPMAFIIGIVAGPIAINICYTLGWLVEAPLRLIKPTLSPKLSPILLKLGIGFSMLFFALPALFSMLPWMQLYSWVVSHLI